MTTKSTTKITKVSTPLKLPTSYQGLDLYYVVVPDNILAPLFSLQSSQVVEERRQQLQDLQSSGENSIWSSPITDYTLEFG